MSLASLAWTYLRSRALLALSAIAIALGVGVLFAVLGVLNGFLSQFESTLREFAGDAVVQPFGGREGDAGLQRYREVLGEVDGIASIEPRINWFALVGRRGARAVDDPRSADLSGLLLVGVEADALASIMPDADLEPRSGIGRAMWLGDEAAKRLGLTVGDDVELVTFYTGSRGLPTPARATFRLAGTFDTGSYDQDLDRALVLRRELASVVHSDDGFTEIVLRGEAKLEPELLAERAQLALRQAGLSPGEISTVSTWRAQGGNFLRAVENQRGILATVFFFIVLVAAYQLVATLTLTVTEKRRDIAVLGALGATPGRVVTFFVFLGLLVAICGVLLGLALGYWLSRNLATVERWVGGGERIFTAEVYKFDEIPVAVELPSVLILVGATLLAALVFSFLPAWRAARTNIVRALHGR